MKAEALSPEEREELNKHTQPEGLEVLVNVNTREVYGTNYDSVARVLSRFSQKRFRYPAGAQVAWESYEFYTFEEDAEWSILEKFTDIRAKGHTTWSEERMREHAEKTFQGILKHRAEQEVRRAKEESGAYMLVSALGKGERVHAIFKNKEGHEKGAMIESSEAYNRVRFEAGSATYEDFEREGVIVAKAPTSFNSEKVTA